MNAARAKRRWMGWLRYNAKTQSVSQSVWKNGPHQGEVKAYSDHMHAKRYAPIGLRVPYYPRWAVK
jgi:hypothetical protein